MKPEDSSKTSQLTGRVLDQEGRPAEGVHVRIEPGPHLTTTNVEGTFEFDRLASRTYAVSARKDRFYAGPTLVDASAGGPPVTLRLRLGTTFIVNVIADRAPVIGARLTLQHGHRAETDETGHATVHGLAPGHYSGVVLADGWADEHLMLSLHDDPGGLVERMLVLVPGARIEGVVLDSNGKPVDEAVVVAWSTREGQHPCRTWSAGDGTWQFSARSGTYRLAAQSKAHGRSAEITFTSDGRSGQRDVVLRLVPSRTENVIASVIDAAKRLIGATTETTIAGVVLDENGAPASEADVRVIQRRFVRADSNGRFEVEDLEPGDYEIVADWGGPWFAPRKSAVRQSVRAGDTNVRIVLPTGATVSGRVMLEGQPVTYFGLRLVPERERPTGGIPIGVRDDGGRFVLRHVNPGKWRIAVVSSGTRLATSSEFLITHNETIELGDIALTRGQRLSGSVRDQAGAAVANARVIVGRMASWAADRSMLERLFTCQYEVRTNADGRYTFDGIDVHREPMRVSEIVWATHVAAGVSVMHEVPNTDATMDFVLLGSGRIEGSVQNMRGGRGHLQAVRADEPPYSRHAHCDKEGHFHFEDLPAGDYVVKLDVPDSEEVAPASVTVVAGETAVATLAMKGASVKLKVKVPAGRGKDLVVEPVSEGAAIGGRVRGIMGMGKVDYCSLEYVRPGHYRVSLDGERWTSITVEASPDEQTIDLVELG